MKNRRNYYRLLNVQPDAPAEVIRSSYRTMMQRMRMHPDLGGDDERAALLNEAYETLINPASRAQYDATRGASPRRSAGAESGRAQASRVTTLPVSCDQDCIFCSHPHSYDLRISADAHCDNCQSPLALARPAQIEDSDRRAILRMSRQLPLSFYTHWPQEPTFAVSSDISLNGMKFHSSASLIENQLIKLDSRILKAVGRVTHSRQEGGECAVGVEFVKLRFTQSRGSFVAVLA
jgi:curved DNA-binding protein CbpA